VKLEESGFLGVQLDMGATRATIGTVTKDTAAEKAGIQPKDTIIQVEGNEIIDQETLINTLQTYKVGDRVKIKVERDGKTIELLATLGKRPADLLKGGNRGDFQNMMGSSLSDRRSGIPRFFQTDAVIRPSDCGAPVVDLDGHVVGIAIARAGRTESHVIPAETVKELLPVLLAAKESGPPAKRVEIARQALKKAEEGKAAAPVVGEARRLLGLALAEEKWWHDHPLEKAPAPHEIDVRQGPAPRQVSK
jgi:serine protease Do